jgi:D-alanyl-D-alanine carboxypeptidase/D-alanyl-D-alanine-endopeptidase (penicillin-binding protein 4)
MLNQKTMRQLFLFFALLPVILYSQTVKQKLQAAFTKFENDPQLASAISSMYVIDAKTGIVVFEKNSKIGLAPASTQKVITSVTAFELLGSNYRYETKLLGALPLTKGGLFFNFSGDPTLGSDRYENTKPQKIFNNLLNAIKKAGVNQISSPLGYNDVAFPYQTIPDRWIWEDIGNYFGAGASIVNWKENKFEIILNSANNDGSVTVVSPNKPFINEIIAGPKGSGDNAYCYIPLHSNIAYLKGSIPVGEKQFSIFAADHNPGHTMLTSFEQFLNSNNIKTNSVAEVVVERTKPVSLEVPVVGVQPIYTHYSPALDSIIFWFNKKSINLYGEALVKTMGGIKKENASTDSGVAVIKQFWKTKGIAEYDLSIYDGSGLSPMNRVTTRAMVDVLKYAKNKLWFPQFYNSLPLYNGMMMKSGTIESVKGFCGYHKSKSGQEYIFSFLVNNYNGKSADLVRKMYKVLDELK